MNTRIYFLDNLRTFLIFLVILYHSGMVYQHGFEASWIVSDLGNSKAIGLIGLYLDAFVMFTIFFISGYFMPNSIVGKPITQVIGSKFRRIMIPWLVGVVTLIPFYKFLFLQSRSLPQEDWYSYFHFFQRTGEDASLFSNDPTQHWLWFLPVLFLFQVLYMVFSKFKLLSFRLSLQSAVALVFVFGLTYSKVISGLGMRGWTYSAVLDFQTERLLIYFMMFLLGSLCNKLGVFDSGKRNKKYYILSNIVLTLALSVFTVTALNFFFNIVNPERNYFFVSEPIDGAIYYATLILTMLSLMHVLIDGFQFGLNKTNRVMKHLNQNSYYVYIIHMIVLGLWAMVLVDSPLPTFGKYLLLTMLTFVSCHGSVFVVRRVFNK